MADQIKIRRRQRKDTLMNITRDNITATLNAAAVVAAAGPLPYLNNFNALLYKQLQQNMQPTASFLTSPSPTGSATESNSYSPTGSLNHFTPSPPDALKAAVNGQNSTASSSSLVQLPLLFQTPAVSGVLNSLPTTALTCTSLPDSLTTTSTGAAQIAMPVAINPLLSAAACSSSAVQAAAAAASNRNILAAAAATLPSVIDNGQFFHSLLANVRLLEQKMCAIEKQQRDEAASSAFVDVCSM
uniref:Uncharacterized protein n=2 Tax=Parascaris univalens TaxID=6257 RepID=A0A914ZMV6_PARUN